MIWDEFLREQERKGPKNRPKHTRKRIHQAKKNFLEKFKTASDIICAGAGLSASSVFHQHEYVQASSGCFVPVPVTSVSSDAFSPVSAYSVGVIPYCLLNIVEKWV